MPRTGIRLRGLSSEGGTIATSHERTFTAKGFSAIDGSPDEFLATCWELAASGEDAGQRFVEWIWGLTSPPAPPPDFSSRPSGRLHGDVVEC